MEETASPIETPSEDPTEDPTSEASSSFTIHVSTPGPQVAPGEEATALLYADVPEDMVLESISYTDEVATGGREITLPVG